MTQSITPKQLYNMFIKAEQAISSRRAILDNLNVYPVPDGDTGANMSLTMKEVVNAIGELKDFDLQKLTSVIAESSLMGARGNSGVILSQFIGGFCESLKRDEINMEELTEAFEAGTKEAFSSVSNPVEGTILTVMKAATEAFSEKGSLSKKIDKVLNNSIKTLKATPEMLPTLKDAGVVDAGGAGFVCFVEGLYRALTNDDKKDSLSFLSTLSEKFSLSKIEMDESSREVTEHKHRIDAWHKTPDERYCTEGILTGVEKSSFDLKNELKKMGSSLIVAKKGKYTKIHFHVKNKDEAKKYFESIGALKKFKADDLHSQHKDFLHAKSIKKKKGTQIIAVVNGEGFKDLYESIPGVTTIYGGETMNPSVAQFEMAIANAEYTKVILVPNNKNIFMAAEKAAGRNEVDVQVLRTTDQAQGLHSLLNFNPKSSLDANLKSLENTLQFMNTFSVAKASKDIKTGEINVKAGDFVATSNKGIIEKGTTIQSIIESIITAQREPNELITLYTGEKTTDSEINAIKSKLETTYNIEVQVYDGSQPHYELIVALE